jgi:hypothetical protein
MGDPGAIIIADAGGWSSGPMLDCAPALTIRPARATRPGETRLWCATCDPDREHPFWGSADLVRHVMEARASGTGQHHGR